MDRRINITLIFKYEINKWNILFFILSSVRIHFSLLAIVFLSPSFLLLSFSSFPCLHLSLRLSPSFLPLAFLISPFPSLLISPFFLNLSLLISQDPIPPPHFRQQRGGEGRGRGEPDGVRKNSLLLSLPPSSPLFPSFPLSEIFLSLSIKVKFLHFSIQEEGRGRRKKRGKEGRRKEKK